MYGAACAKSFHLGHILEESQKTKPVKQKIKAGLVV